MVLVVVVHVIGALMLVWALVDPEQRAGWWRRWRGGGDDPAPEPPAPEPAGERPAGRPLPLPASDPSHVRLREPARVADGYPRPARRPAHPQPEPEREPATPA